MVGSDKLEKVNFKIDCKGTHDKGALVGGTWCHLFAGDATDWCDLPAREHPWLYPTTLAKHSIRGESSSYLQPSHSPTSLYLLTSADTSYKPTRHVWILPRLLLHVL